MRHVEHGWPQIHHISQMYCTQSPHSVVNKHITTSTHTVSVVCYIYSVALPAIQLVFSWIWVELVNHMSSSSPAVIQNGSERNQCVCKTAGCNTVLFLPSISKEVCLCCLSAFRLLYSFGGIVEMWYAVF